MLSDKIQNCINDAALGALNEFNASFKRRIQQQGQATGGEQIGRYSKDYAAYRKEQGRQVAKVDLTLSGDMINSIQVGEINGNFAVGFDEIEQVKKAIDNESIFKKPIFKASDDEIELIRTMFKEIYQECLSR